MFSGCNQILKNSNFREKDNNGQEHMSESLINLNNNKILK